VAAMSSTGRRMVVSGGLVHTAAMLSSKPMTPAPPTAARADVVGDASSGGGDGLPHERSHVKVSRAAVRRRTMTASAAVTSSAIGKLTHRPAVPRWRNASSNGARTTGMVPADSQYE
jgi:hypothetical protein